RKKDRGAPRTGAPRSSLALGLVGGRRGALALDDLGLLAEEAEEARLEQLVLELGAALVAVLRAELGDVLAGGLGELLELLLDVGLADLDLLLLRERVEEEARLDAARRARLGLRHEGVEVGRLAEHLRELEDLVEHHALLLFEHARGHGDRVLVDERLDELILDGRLRALLRRLLEALADVRLERVERVELAVLG